MRRELENGGRRMGRRAEHSLDELRSFCIQAAYDIIEKRGLNGLSARAIALDIGYSPGTIYNAFASLDDLVLNVEARLLRELDQHLESAAEGASGESAVVRLARAFVDFAGSRRNLWNLLTTNRSASTSIPDWYSERLAAPQARIAGALSSLQKSCSDSDVKRHSCTISTILFGVAALSTSDRMAHLAGGRQAPDIAENLARSYLDDAVSKQRF